MVAAETSEKPSQASVEDSESVADPDPSDVEEMPDIPPEDFAAYLGEPSADDLVDSNAGGPELLSFDDANKRIPAKTKALMEELFRAKRGRVQRFDPKRLL